MLSPGYWAIRIRFREPAKKFSPSRAAGAARGEVVAGLAEDWQRTGRFEATGLQDFFAAL
jgi:hypothetical protein